MPQRSGTGGGSPGRRLETIAFQFEPIPLAGLDMRRRVNAEEIALVADIGGGTSDSRWCGSPRACAIERPAPGHSRIHRRAHRRHEFRQTVGTGERDAGTGPTRSPLRRKGLDAPSWYFPSSRPGTGSAFSMIESADRVRGVLRDSAEPKKIKRLLRVLEQRKGRELWRASDRPRSRHTPISPAQSRRYVADISREITRAELEAAVADSLQRIRSRIDDVLRMTGLTPDSVSAVFLTGGATRMPSVRKSIAAAVPTARLTAGDAFGSVATGLALDAAKRFAER